MTANNRSEEGGLVTDYRGGLATELNKLETDLLYTEKAHFCAAEPDPVSRTRFLV